MTRVAFYIRVSSEEQARDGYGIPAQITNLEHEVAKFADKGWTHDKSLIYKDEGYSGANAARPAFKKMMLDAKQKKFDVILVWKIDRLFRNIKLLLSFVEEIGYCGVDFKSATEPFDTTSVGKFIFQMFGCIAELERNTILERTVNGKKESAKAGNYVGGAIPFGYFSEDKKIKICEDEAQIVRNIFNWFTKEKYSLGKIADRLTKHKVRSKTDREKRGRRTVNPTGFWVISVVRKILQREAYIGKYYYNRFGKNKEGKIREKPQSEWIVFECPAIIDRQTFWRAQVRLAQLKKYSNNTKNQYLFSTKIVCGNCGSVFTGSVSNKKTKNYRCGKNNKTKVAQVCPAGGISETIIESHVRPYVFKLLENPEEALRQIANRARNSPHYQIMLEEQDKLRENLEENRLARNRVKEAFRRGVYSQEELAEEVRILDGQLDDIQNELAAIEAELSASEDRQSKALSIKEMAESLSKSIQNPTYEDRRDIYQAIINKITVKSEKIRIELYVPKAEPKDVVQERRIQKSLKTIDSRKGPTKELEVFHNTKEVIKSNDAYGGTGWS